jgi:alpha-L-fucosidase
MKPSKERTESIAAWENLKYGMFIHYGLSTFTGGDRDEEDRPSTTYAPTHLDVGQWINVERDAGMTYAVLTVKHHTGHCLWSSEFTDYDVSTSADTSDVVDLFVAACRDQGIKAGLYYSILDGHHEPGEGWNWNHDSVGPEYFSFMKNQLRELHTRYPDIAEQWFDITWKLTATQRAELYTLIKGMNPACMVIMNNGFTSGVDVAPHAFPTDLVNGEKTLPPPDGHDPRKLVDGEPYYIPMEVCETLGDRWFWTSGDSPRPGTELMEIYRAVRARNANLLLNVPPDQTGRIPAVAVVALQELKGLIVG